MSKHVENKTESGGIAQFCVEHPRGRHGGVIYALDELGLDVPEGESRFSAYRERFVS